LLHCYVILETTVSDSRVMDDHEVDLEWSWRALALTLDGGNVLQVGYF
jgi:hypothetical protein